MATTTAVHATLVGIAIDRGVLPSTSASIADLGRGHASAAPRPRSSKRSKPLPTPRVVTAKVTGSLHLGLSVANEQPTALSRRRRVVR